MGGAINNTNTEQNSTLTITNINPKFITSGINDNIDNEVDINALNALSVAIKDIDIKLITGKVNNNINIKINTNVFMSKIISKTDTKLTISRLYKANIIIKKIYMNLICSSYC